MGNYTPAPWSKRGRDVFADDGNVNPIATIHTVSGIWDTNEANANLIAAAPEMFDALDHFVFCTDDPCDTCYELAGAALAKARGGRND